MRYVIAFCLLWLSGCASVPDAPVDRYRPAERFYYDDENYLDYRVVGDGAKALLLFHGYGASNHNWDDLLPLLDLGAYRLILFDLIGAGHSSRPRDVDYSVLANAALVDRFIDQQKLDQYALMGHSFGGGVALATTLRRQAAGKSAPQKLVLLDALSYPHRLPLFVRAARIPGVGKAVLKLLSPALLARISLGRAFHDSGRIREDQLQRYSRFLSEPDYAGAIVQMARDIVPEGFELLIAAYPTIAVPTLVLWGAQDRVLNADLGVRLVADIPGAQWQLLADCGHNIQEECPRPTAAAISAFIAAPID